MLPAALAMWALSYTRVESSDRFDFLAEVPEYRAGSRTQYPKNNIHSANTNM